MKLLIRHFKICSYGFNINSNEVYSRIEAPKEEFGVFYILTTLINLIDVNLDLLDFFIYKD